MKKKGLVAIVAALALCSCTQKAENEFVLKGNISNYPNEKIYFMLGDAMGGNPVLDSADVTDGKFEYRGSVDEPQRLSITDRVVSMSKYDPNIKGISIYIEPKIMNLSMDHCTGSLAGKNRYLHVFFSVKMSMASRYPSKPLPVTVATQAARI